MGIEINDRELYKLSELSEKLGIGKNSLRRKIREGKLRANKLGRELVIWGADLREYVDSQGRGNRGGFAKQLLLKTAKPKR